MRVSAISGLLMVLLAAVSPVAAQAQPQPIPKIVSKDGRHALLVDGRPFLIMGAQAHNSSAWPAMLPKVWPAMKYLGVNTVELPVYWEQLEPQPDRFDFDVVDTLLAQARQNDVRLVLLWFGTWKNGSAHYRPEWMKREPERFPNIVARDGKANDSPSPFSKDALDADIRAFSALMRHLRQVDPQRTVIMVQVENEPGTWGSMRDYSPAAERLFKAAVPEQLLRATGRAADHGKNWRAVFGDDADEFFHAWSVAHYIGQVAAAGKAIYPLPLYTNAALKDPLQAGRTPPYEFGGATYNVLPIWKAAAPSLDLLAPDIYQPPAKVLPVMDQYSRADNPLFIPETISAPPYVRFFYAAIAKGAIGYAPFGIDYTALAADPPGSSRLRQSDLEQLELSYRAIGPMMREIAQWTFENKVHAAIETEDKAQPEINLGRWKAKVRFGVAMRGEGNGNEKPIGRVLVTELGPDEFIVTGFYANVRFEPAGKDAGRPWQFLKVEEGQFADGQFHPVRIWNGDETDWGLNFVSAPQVLRVTLGTR
jgi:hypothetical protein